MTATLVAELPELGSLSRAKIAKLVGVAPMIKQSRAQRYGTTAEEV
jgi:transposase